MSWQRSELFRSWPCTVFSNFFISLWHGLNAFRYSGIASSRLNTQINNKTWDALKPSLEAFACLFLLMERLKAIYLFRHNKNYWIMVNICHLFLSHLVQYARLRQRSVFLTIMVSIILALIALLRPLKLPKRVFINTFSLKNNWLKFVWVIKGKHSKRKCAGSLTHIKICQCMKS